jgi:hypothetical protein
VVWDEREATPKEADMATTKPMSDNDLRWASNIPGILRHADKPHMANTIQALVDEVARLKAREVELEAEKAADFDSLNKTIERLEADLRFAR